MAMKPLKKKKVEKKSKANSIEEKQKEIDAIKKQIADAEKDLKKSDDEVEEELGVDDIKEDEKSEEESEEESKEPAQVPDIQPPIKQPEIIVVNELPTQPVRTYIDDAAGTQAEFITRDEALKEILERLRKLDEED